ncbi:MAG: alpha/beta hydrolase [Acidobacteria bacterium]|nr:alpha/beta hydrolase [Acidobacteriota bacterium]
MKIIQKIVSVLLSLIAIAVVAFIIFWYSRPADVSFEEMRSSVPNSQYSKFAEIDGIKLHYQEKGTGIPVVLIHGFTSSTYTWKDVFGPLSEKYRVIAIDLKGFGFSEKPEGDYSRREQGKLVIGLLSHLKIENAWMVGNSMGGETALNAALQAPEKIRGLILVDSAGVSFESKGGITPWYARLPYVGRWITAIALSGTGIVRAGIERSFYDDSKITDDRVNYYHRLLSNDKAQRAAMLAREQFGDYPIEDKLKDIRIPTLIIWGAEDEVIPLKAGEKMNSLIRDSELRVYEKVGHIPEEEVPEKLTKDVIGFIDATEDRSVSRNETK